MLSNPPFGVEWKKIEKEVRKEAEQQGFKGRFGPGLPRVTWAPPPVEGVLRRLSTRRRRERRKKGSREGTALHPSAVRAKEPAAGSFAGLGGRVISRASR
jgi:hypothetical protein